MYKLWKFIKWQIKFIRFLDTNVCPKWILKYFLRLFDWLLERAFRAFSSDVTSGQNHLFLIGKVVKIAQTFCLDLGDRYVPQRMYWNVSVNGDRWLKQSNVFLKTRGMKIHVHQNSVDIWISPNVDIDIWNTTSNHVYQVSLHIRQEIFLLFKTFLFITK